MWKYMPGTVFGLTLGHLAYQWLLSEPSYATAIERAFFQTVGIACFIVVCKINGVKDA